MGRFTNNGNGTVTDVRTGLMWERCMVGYTFSDNGTPNDLADDSCTPSATVTFLWQQALQGVVDRNAQGGIAGFTDWRLPNIRGAHIHRRTQLRQPGDQRGDISGYAADRGSVQFFNRK